MKKLMIITTFLLSGLCSANAQKGKINDVVLNPNKAIIRVLPDLTFDLIPVLVGGGYGFEQLKGTISGIKIPINFIVKNIGLATSKPCKVYAIITYLRPRNRIEIEQGISADAWLGNAISEPITLQALANGKDILLNQNFIFSKISDTAWGKRIRLTLKIEYGILNGEQSAKNNQSEVVEFALTR